MGDRVATLLDLLGSQQFQTVRKSVTPAAIQILVLSIRMSTRSQPNAYENG